MVIAVGVGLVGLRFADGGLKPREIGLELANIVYEDCRGWQGIPRVISGGAP